MALFFMMPAALQDMISLPGAQISGLTLPSFVGPLELNEAMLSLLSVAPTVNAAGVSAGQPTVPSSGPLLPAAQTTILPLLTAFATRSSIAWECSFEPRDMEMIFASLRAA